MVPVDRQDLGLLMEAGYVYLGMGRPDEARDVFEGVSILDDRSEVPWVAMGTVHFAGMRYDKAILAYRKALRKKKDSPFAHAYLGEAFFFKGNDSEAVKELQTASGLDPKGPAGDFARALLAAIQGGFKPPGRVKR